MLKLMGLEINAILGAQMIIIWTYVKWALSCENPDFGLSDQVGQAHTSLLSYRD